MIIFISILTLFFFLDDKRLNTAPKKKNAIKLVEAFTMLDDEGFYSRTSASVSSNGKVVLLDAGNKVLHIYNAKGKHLKTFGEEGSGPGEMSRPFRVFTTKDRILVREDTRVNMYDFDGNSVKDISLIVGGSVGTPMIYNDQFAISFRGNSKYLYVLYDNKGERIKAVDNTKYVAPKGEQGINVMISTNIKLYGIPNGFIRAESGAYRYTYLDENLNEKQSFVKHFDRVKQDFSRFKFDIDGDGMTKEQKAKELQRIRSSLKARFGEYRDDVSSILGIHDNKLFISTASEDENVLKIDVIENGEYYTQITLENDDEIKEVRITAGRLVVNFNNKEDGPYAKVYDIKSI